MGFANVFNLHSVCLSISLNPLPSLIRMSCGPAIAASSPGRLRVHEPPFRKKTGQVWGPLRQRLFVLQMGFEA